MQRDHFMLGMPWSTKTVVLSFQNRPVELIRMFPSIIDHSLFVKSKVDLLKDPR